MIARKILSFDKVISQLFRSAKEQEEGYLLSGGRIFVLNRYKNALWEQIFGKRIHFQISLSL